MTGSFVPVLSLALRDKEIVTQMKIARVDLSVEQTIARIFIPLHKIVRIVV